MYLASTKRFGIGDDTASSDDNWGNDIEIDSTVSTGDFDSTRYPGICKPTNETALNRVLFFQRQLNRVAQMKNLPKIQVDGDVGPATLKLWNAVMGTSATDCSGIALAVVSEAISLKAQADSVNIPADVPSPTLTKPPSYAPSGKPDITVRTPETGIIATLGGLPTPVKLALVAVVGVVGYKMSKKGRARRAATRRYR